MAGSKRRKHKKRRKDPVQTLNNSGDGRSPKRKRSKSSCSEKGDASSQLSLASRLKRVRGTADSTPLPPEWSQQQSTSRSYLTPDDGTAFESCRKECYGGFYWDPPEKLPVSLHSMFDQAFDALHGEGLFLYDTVQPGGKRLSKTMVTRTLLGNPGSTYRYLGLRLFSHPWTDVTDDGDAVLEEECDGKSLVSLGYSDECVRALLAIGKLNTTLVDRTKVALDTEIAPHVPQALVGSADYTLTLINRMEPTCTKKDLKRDKAYGMGKTSVSWHKDSGLVDFSSIAVYHSLRGESGEDPWKVAMRVADKSTRTPPLAVPLPSGSLYYLLDDFNHKHEHAVIAGSNQLRYSSTHRVAREGRGTWQYIRDKCRSVVEKMQQPPSGTLSERRKRLVKDTRAQQQLLDEIEFEWVRQWFIQGREHARLHPYWHKPIQQLEGWFQDLEQRCLQTIEQVRTSSKKRDLNKDSLVTDDLFDVLIEAMEERSKLRMTWRERVKDPIFETMPESTRQFRSPVLDRPKEEKAYLPEDLTTLITDLRKCRKRFVKQKGKGDAAANLTKKEKRKVASNWERMQASFQR